MSATAQAQLAPRLATSMHFSRQCPSSHADDTKSDGTKSDGTSRRPFLLVVDPDDHSRDALASGLRAGIRGGMGRRAALTIEAGATAAWAREALGRPSACAAMVCDARVGTLGALSLIDEVRRTHEEALSMVIGPMSDHGLMRACAQRLAIYAPSPADPVTLAALAGNAVDRLNAEAVEARLAAVAARAEELRLTRRQADVLGLLVRGIPARAICAHLRITRSTYRKHVATILVRTGYKRTADLLASWDREN